MCFVESRHDGTNVKEAAGFFSLQWAVCGQSGAALLGSESAALTSSHNIAQANLVTGKSLSVYFLIERKVAAFELTFFKQVLGQRFFF